MSGRIFLDTNVLVYAYSSDNPKKREQALYVCQIEDAWLSTQVLTEFINIFRKKFGSTWAELNGALSELTANYPVHLNTSATLKTALGLAERYQLSWFDSMIVAAALECECETLYSEDLHSGLLINQQLTITNPFR